MPGTRDEWSGPATASTVGEIRRAVVRFATDASLTATDLDNVRSCVSEAVTNAVMHAFPHGAPGTIAVSAELRGAELIVVVNDDGIGFRPRLDSPGLGLGMPTISVLAGSMSVTRSPQGGTALCMAFPCERAAQSSPV
jgi:anti-sigma regulatory factor (Ser/Thr protein kinase)